MNNSDKKIIRLIFEKMKQGDFPNFGSPETKCDKCMFYGIACFPSSEYVGCLGGWKREAD